MLKAELCVRTFYGYGLLLADQSNVINHPLTIPNSSLYGSHSYPFTFQFLALRSPKIKNLNSALISCKNHTHGRFNPKSHHYSEPNGEYLEASVLIAETVKHYRFRKQGFEAEEKQVSGQFVPFPAQVKDLRAGVNSLGLGILRRYQNPTIFFKISCEEDFLLPIVVGEFAVENLIDSLDKDDVGDYTDQFQFVGNLVDELEYEVKMVKITERVVNTYFGKVYFGKVGERESFSVDARPSDAINVAKRCKAPIYVNKRIVLMDAIRVAYGTGRVRDTKPVYDVLLDSPLEGPDLLVEELNLAQNVKLAVKEERYNDAAMWRDKLVKLRDSGVGFQHRKEG